MICVIALVVFGILGIFSASYRKLAAKAFDCVFRRITLRPCQAGVDQQLRTGILSYFSKKNVKVARLIAKHFEIISWFFTILLVLSIIFSIRGIYFYVVYGNCNGEDTNQFCIFDALHPNEATCEDPNLPQNKNFSITPSVDDDPFFGLEDAKVTIIEFGCYSCPYTKKAEPIVKEILKNYEGKIRFVYRDFHIPTHPGSDIRAVAAECAKEQGKYWEYHDLLFENQEQNLTILELKQMAKSLGLNDGFDVCLDNMKYLNETIKDFDDGKLAGVYGTPTFFINNQVVVGSKPYVYFKNIIESELKKSP